MTQARPIWRRVAVLAIGGGLAFSDDLVILRRSLPLASLEESDFDLGGSAFDLVRLCTRRRKPASRRWPAIGAPMAPRPMNPTFMQASCSTA